MTKKTRRKALGNIGKLSGRRATDPETPAFSTTTNERGG
jgi:hypothetical protein